MECKKVEKQEAWINHIEPLDLICATNTGNAERARMPAGRARMALVVNGAKAALAARMQCGNGTCRRGLTCVQPAIGDVKVVRGSASLDTEAKAMVPQPEAGTCERNEKQYKVDAIINFTISAKCKCVRPPAPPPGAGIKKPRKKAAR